jgi:hypothetical protein
MDYEVTPATETNVENVGCPVVGYQDVNVSVPITIKPFGEVGNATTKCLKQAMVMSGDEATGTNNGTCKFTIRQKLRVEVPVVFGARAEAGEASVECGGDSDFSLSDCPCNK